MNAASVIGKYTVAIKEQPICLNIKGSNKPFVMIFSAIDSLHETIGAYMTKFYGTVQPYDVMEIKTANVVTTFLNMGLRIMVDPELREGNITAWKEIENV